jgi:3',5'-cyclic AMP phosphodiesterase CpdA
MTRILHLSDTHFGTEVESVVDALHQTVATLQPDVVVLSGDITQRARESQFEAAAAFLAYLPGRHKCAIPGNHDIPLFDLWQRFTKPYKLYWRYFGARFWRLDAPPLRLIGLDATHPLRHTKGCVPLRRARKLLTKLPPNGNCFRAVAVHQPFQTASAKDIPEILLNAKKSASLFAHHGIDLVLTGHVHFPLITTTRELYPDVKRHFILCGAGTAISHRIRPGAPNSFNVIDLLENTDSRRIRITPYHYDADTEQFNALPVKSFSLQPTGWEVENAS